MELLFREYYNKIYGGYVILDFMADRFDSSRDDEVNTGRLEREFDAVCRSLLKYVFFSLHPSL